MYPHGLLYQIVQHLSIVGLFVSLYQTQHSLHLCFDSLVVRPSVTLRSVIVDYIAYLPPPLEATSMLAQNGMSWGFREIMRNQSGIESQSKFGIMQTPLIR